jgi:serine/threonine-protein kinase
MIARFQLCDRRQLELALADRLPASQAEDLSSHLQHCEHCRADLEQMAGEKQWWDDARSFLSSTDDVVAIDSSGAVQTSAAATQHESHDEPGDDEMPLHFLSPPSRPGLLGQLGHYDIEGVIGRGGMGIVLKAQDTVLNRLVAIKVLAGHLAQSGAARKRFAREAQAAAAVVHDHVIPIHSVETSGETPFLVMPYVSGPSLQDRLDQAGTLEIKEVLRIALQTAQGLAAAHAQGLVHRDIKPANILLENGVERVRITDFGLARAVDDASQTQSGFIAGTPQYMAPEQARGESIDSRADLFSLGSVMYAMCTGHPPFRAETTLAVLRRICDDGQRNVREVNSEVPSWLAAIIDKLLTKSPDQRYQTAEELANLLEQWIAHLQQPTVIKPPVPLESVRSRRLSFVQVAVAAVLMLAASMAITWQVSSYWQQAQTDHRPAAGQGSPKKIAEPPAILATGSISTEVLAWEEKMDAELSSVSQHVAELEADTLARPADVTPTAQQLADLVKLLRELEQGFSIPASPASTPPGPENFDPNNSPYPSLERSTK